LNTGSSPFHHRWPCPALLEKGIHATVELLFGRVPLDQKRKNEIFGMTLKVDVINILVNDSYF
jgi:hypothetical protein